MFDCLFSGLRGRNITCDSCFTSHQLATKLKQSQMTMVGAIRKNRKEIPSSLVDMKKKPLHHTEAVFDHNLRACMLSYVPKNRRFVTMLSTYHATVDIDRNDPRKRPEIIQFYDRTKGGVDALDELIATYRCRRKVNRWPVALFCHMLDISACNAFIIHTKMNPSWQWSIEAKNARRKFFLKELGQSLCSPYTQRHKSSQRNSNAPVLARTRNLPSTSSSNVKQLEQPSQSLTHQPVAKKRTSSSSVKQLEQPSQSLTHQPVTKKRARCYMCPSRPNSNNHSTRCDKCVKYICPSHYYKVCETCAPEIHLN